MGGFTNMQLQGLAIFYSGLILIGFEGFTQLKNYMDFLDFKSTYCRFEVKARST